MGFCKDWCLHELCWIIDDFRTNIQCFAITNSIPILALYRSKWKSEVNMHGGLEDYTTRRDLESIFLINSAKNFESSILVFFLSSNICSLLFKVPKSSTAFCLLYKFTEHDVYLVMGKKNRLDCVKKSLFSVRTEPPLCDGAEQ